MTYTIYKSKNESVLKNLEALEGLFVFPSIGYELINKDIRKLSLECILMSYKADNNKVFEASFLNHLARIDEYTFYSVLETDNLNKEKEKISSSTYMVNFISALNYAPFFITNRNILIYQEDSEPFEDTRYGDIDRFVGNGQFNLLLILLDKFKFDGKTIYQTKKFENAVLALRWIIDHGFPYKRIIDWEKNKIIDDNIKRKIISKDVPFETNFIEGNAEYRFCRMIRFVLKEFIFARRKILGEILSLNAIDPASSLFFFEIIKKSLINEYIFNTQPLNNIFNTGIYKKLRNTEIFSPAFIITMRISQPEGFTEKILEEKKKHPILLNGMKWDIKPVKTLIQGKQRYEICIYAGTLVNILNLCEILEELKKLFIRLLFNTGLDYKYMAGTNTEFWLNYLEIVIPNINQEITKTYEDMLNKELGLELIYSSKFKKLYEPNKNEVLFRLGFGYLSKLNLDRLSINKSNLDRLDRCDPFTRAAIIYALSGKYIRGEKLLNEVSKLLEVDRNLDIPPQFYFYILNIEKDLIPYLTKNHPMAFMSDENYALLIKDIKFFADNYNILKDFNDVIKNAVQSNEKTENLNMIINKLKYLGIYKEKDLSYLENICRSMFLFFGAKYRRNSLSALGTRTNAD